MVDVADPDRGHAHDAYHRFLREGRWETAQLWRRLAPLLVSQLEGNLRLVKWKWKWNRERRSSHARTAGVLWVERLSRMTCTSRSSVTSRSILFKNAMTSAAEWDLRRPVMTLPVAFCGVVGSIGRIGADRLSAWICGICGSSSTA
jgi:hypothetical protein